MVFDLEKYSMDYCKEETKPRIRWVDICKGIAIILMILGHIKGSYLGCRQYVV